MLSQPVHSCFQTTTACSLICTAEPNRKMRVLASKTSSFRKARAQEQSAQLPALGGTQVVSPPSQLCSQDFLHPSTDPSLRISSFNCLMKGFLFSRV